MRFLVIFVAVLGYASASVIAPLAYGVNAGDAQAAAIDATVAAQDHARAINEGNARLAETAYWGNVAAGQSAVAAAQGNAAAWNGVVAARTAYGAPLLGAPYGIAAPYINGLATPYGLGLHAW